jgi:hypothetical protein
MSPRVYDALRKREVVRTATEVQPRSDLNLFPPRPPLFELAAKAVTQITDDAIATSQT